jgi:hypothetical protein
MDLDGFRKFCLVPVSARHHSTSFREGSGRALPFLFMFFHRRKSAQFARESVCRVTLDSIAGLMHSRHRQERENVKALTFGVENDHVSGFGWKRNKIPVRHPIFIPVRISNTNGRLRAAKFAARYCWAV